MDLFLALLGQRGNLLAREIQIWIIGNSRLEKAATNGLRDSDKRAGQNVLANK